MTIKKILFKKIPLGLPKPIPLLVREWDREPVETGIPEPEPQDAFSWPCERR